MCEDNTEPFEKFPNNAFKIMPDLGILKQDWDYKNVIIFKRKDIKSLSTFFNKMCGDKR